MPEFSRDESLRVIALEQAVIANQIELMGTADLAKVFYDFLRAKPEPGVTLAGEDKYTYWECGGRVTYRTRDGYGPGIMAEYKDGNGDWKFSGWATWRVLKDHSDYKEVGSDV